MAEDRSERNIENGSAQTEGNPPLPKTSETVNIPPRTTPTILPASPTIARRQSEFSISPHENSQIGSYGDSKKLIVGREIALTGKISACEKLVVEGQVEADLKECREIEIAESGIFKGEADIEIAEIGGIFEGKITARKLLVVRSTGLIIGEAQFEILEVERGGKIKGTIENIASADDDG